MTNFRSAADPGLDAAFRALADPTRRAVVARLVKGPASVSDLARPFDMAMSTFLKHLKALEAGGLIVSEKKGRVRTCSIEPEALSRAESWLAGQRALWEGRLDRLEAYQDELKGVEKADD